MGIIEKAKELLKAYDDFSRNLRSGQAVGIFIVPGQEDKFAGKLPEFPKLCRMGLLKETTEDYFDICYSKDYKAIQPGASIPICLKSIIAAVDLTSPLSKPGKSSLTKYALCKDNASLIFYAKEIPQPKIEKEIEDLATKINKISNKLRIGPKIIKSQKRIQLLNWHIFQNVIFNNSEQYLEMVVQDAYLRRY